MISEDLIEEYYKKGEELVWHWRIVDQSGFTIYKDYKIIWVLSTDGSIIYEAHNGHRTLSTISKSGYTTDDIIARFLYRIDHELL